MRVRSGPAIGRPMLLLFSLWLWSCSPAGTGASPDANGSASSTLAEPSATILPTATSTAAASESTPAPTPYPPETSAGPTTEAPSEGPPTAWLQVEGGDPVPGDLGTFSWKNAGSASPWLPGEPLHVGAGEVLLFAVAPPGVVANWTASRQVPGASLSGVSAIGMGQGSRWPVSFAAPPPGVWSVNVDVWFSGGLGSASYYWLIEVD